LTSALRWLAAKKITVSRKLTVIKYLSSSAPPLASGGSGALLIFRVNWFRNAVIVSLKALFE